MGGQNTDSIGNRLLGVNSSVTDCLGVRPVGCPPLNYMTSYFCGHSPECTDPPDDATFLLAAKHVLDDYSLGERTKPFSALARVFLAHLSPVFQWGRWNGLTSSTSRSSTCSVRPAIGDTAIHCPPPSLLAGLAGLFQYTNDRGQRGLPFPLPPPW